MVERRPQINKYTKPIAISAKGRYDTFGAGRGQKNEVEFSPVSMNMFGAVGIADVDEGGVDHDVLLTAVEQVVEQSEVAVAAADAVPRAILVQDVHLTGRIPSCAKF